MYVPEPNVENTSTKYNKIALQMYETEFPKAQTDAPNFNCNFVRKFENIISKTFQNNRAQPAQLYACQLISIQVDQEMMLTVTTNPLKWMLLLIVECWILGRK